MARYDIYKLQISVQKLIKFIQQLRLEWNTKRHMNQEENRKMKWVVRAVNGTPFHCVSFSFVVN
jgi:hypothetical protein